MLIDTQLMNFCLQARLGQPKLWLLPALHQAATDIAMSYQLVRIITVCRTIGLRTHNLIVYLTL